MVRSVINTHPHPENHLRLPYTPTNPGGVLSLKFCYSPLPVCSGGVEINLPPPEVRNTQSWDKSPPELSRGYARAETLG